MRFIFAVFVFSFLVSSSAFAEKADEPIVQAGNKLFLYVPGEVEFETTFEVDKKVKLTYLRWGNFRSVIKRLRK